MTKIEFELFGLQLLEPVGFILNWVITAQGIYYFYRLSIQPNPGDFVKYWKGFFILFACSTFFGGLSHLLFNYTGLPGKIPGWSLAVMAVTSMMYSVTSQFDNLSARTKLKRLVTVMFILLMGLLFLTMNFLVVSVHTAIGLLLFLGLGSIIKLRAGEEDYRLLLWGVICMLMTVPFMALGLDLHLWFNRQDASHIFMILALHLFYLGALRVNSGQELVKETVSPFL